MPALPAYIQTENPSYVRQTSSRALLCTDTAALKRHRRNFLKAQNAKKTEHRIAGLEERVNQIAELVEKIAAQLLK